MINLISYQFDVLYESSQFFFSLFFLFFFHWVGLGWGVCNVLNDSESFISFSHFFFSTLTTQYMFWKMVLCFTVWFYAS